jgi:Rrf2 family protein
MKISAKTEYACIAMLDLAAQSHLHEPVRIRKIAERHGVPPRFLVQILLQLKEAGLVASVRGAAGGYHLLRRPEEISLGQIMDVVESDAAGSARKPGASLPGSPLAKVLLQAWHDADTLRRDLLGRITLAQLVRQARTQSKSLSSD